VELIIRCKETAGDYGLAEQFTFDFAQGCTAKRLRNSLAQHLDVPVSQLAIAKYQPSKFSWMVIKSTTVPKSRGKVSNESYCHRMNEEKMRDQVCFSQAFGWLWYVHTCM